VRKMYWSIIVFSGEEFSLEGHGNCCKVERVVSQDGELFTLVRISCRAISIDLNGGSICMLKCNIVSTVYILEGLKLKPPKSTSSYD
jgi:hypothetical protein